jgi:site-specific DNA recombinase
VRTVILRRIFRAFAVGKNRQRFVKDPATGRRVSRPNPESQWIRTEVSHLKIVDDDLWQAARAIILAIATLLLIC